MSFLSDLRAKAEKARSDVRDKGLFATDLSEELLWSLDILENMASFLPVEDALMFKKVLDEGLTDDS